MDSSDSPRTKLRGGLKIDREIVGSGKPVSRGDTLTIRLEIRLNQGDLVESLDEHTFVLGARHVIAAVEYGAEGMRVGGRRELKAGPHLCYSDAGVPGKIPADAVLRLTIELLSCEQPA